MHPARAAAARAAASDRRGSATHRATAARRSHDSAPARTRATMPRPTRPILYTDRHARGTARAHRTWARATMRTTHRWRGADARAAHRRDATHNGDAAQAHCAHRSGDHGYNAVSARTNLAHPKSM